MNTVTAVVLGAVVVSGSMLAASRASVAHDFSSLPAATQSTPAAVAFTHVNVVPMDSERVLRDQTVLVEQGRIRLLGSAGEVEVPADITTVDGSGKYLMPGLAEMHGHMPGGDAEEMVMFLYVANGVTTVRGMLGQDGHMELRRKANAGEIVAPTLYPRRTQLQRRLGVLSGTSRPEGPHPEGAGLGSPEDPPGADGTRVRCDGHHGPRGGHPVWRSRSGRSGSRARH